MVHTFRLVDECVSVVQEGFWPLIQYGQRQHLRDSEFRWQDVGGIPHLYALALDWLEERVL